jgi:hypothetical protein
MMTALNFPDTPADGDIFAAPGGIEWRFEDPLWVLAGTPGGGVTPGPTGPIGAIFTGATQPLAAGAYLGLSWAPAVYDNDPSVELTNANTITFLAGGTYALSCSAAGANLELLLAGAVSVITGLSHPASGWATASGLFSFAAGGVLNARAWNPAAGNVLSPRLEIWRV